MNISTFVHEDRAFSATQDHEVVLSAATVRALLRILEHWSSVERQQETYAQKRFGVPSLIARFDGTFDDAGNFIAYEIENTPTGLGYAPCISEEFAAARDEWVNTSVPGLVLVAGPQRQNHDDHIWLNALSPEEAREKNVPLIIRDGLDRGVDPLFLTRYVPLEGQSITPLQYRHNKRYGVPLGWWRIISNDRGDELPWGESFVLKPLHNGKWGKDVHVWGEKNSHSSSRAQILKALTQRRYMVLQPFFPAQRMDINGSPYNMIMRPYFSFNTRARRWEPLGGMWVARPEGTFRISWAADAISGPLVLKT